MPEHIETVIIGGGHAGLTLSYALTQRGHEHVVLERARVAERWRSERWDSLTLLAPNWASALPGFGHPGVEPNAFATRDELVRYFDAYAASFHAPVRCGIEVTSLRRSATPGRYVLETSGGDIEAANVVVATGPFPQPVVPAACTAMPRDLQQLHSSQYRQPEQLAPGAVLVVGTGSSGFQIAEELNLAGRDVFLSAGRYLPAPRRYRGHHTVWWGVKSGLFDRTVDSLPSPAP
jgi:putative flavoprotein involved in K+ transport